MVESAVDPSLVGVVDPLLVVVVSVVTAFAVADTVVSTSMTCVVDPFLTVEVSVVSVSRVAGTVVSVVDPALTGVVGPLLAAVVSVILSAGSDAATVVSADVPSASTTAVDDPTADSSLAAVAVVSDDSPAGVPGSLAGSSSAMLGDILAVFSTGSAVGLDVEGLDVGESVVGFPLGSEVGCLVGSDDGRFDGLVVRSAVLSGDVGFVEEFALGFDVGYGIIKVRDRN